MLDHWLHSLMPVIQHLSGWVYWIALLAALVETVLVVGLFLPGSSLLLLLGALSAGGGGPSFLGILAFAVAGATLGDNVNYSLGRRYGQRWTKNGLWLLRREHFEQAQAFFARHGGKSVFLARFIPSLKEVAPFVAGTAGMRHGWFFLWNLLGALGWGLQWVGAGYVFARSLALAQLWMSRAGLGIGLFALTLLLLWYLRRAMLRHGPQWWAAARSVARSLVQAVRENPEAQSLLRAHPRLFGVLTARLDRRRFTGLPLTLFVSAFVYLLLLFGGLVEDVVTADPIVALDHSVAELVAALRTPAWVAASVWLSGVGVWQVVLAALAAGGAWLALSGRRAYVLPFWLSVAGSAVFAYAGKLALHRGRPLEAAVREASYAFPSAHATVAVSLFGFLAYVWLRGLRSWPARVNVFFVWVLLALLLGASRIVLGVHYLSDVLGGYLLGGMWLLVGIVWSEWTLSRGAAPPARRLRFAAPLAALFVGSVYVGATVLSPPRLAPETAMPSEAALQVPAHVDLQTFLRRHFPPYVRTALGERAQPLSLVFQARDEAALQSLLSAAGWQRASLPGAASLLRLAREGVSDLRAGPAPLFWNGRLYAMAYNRREAGVSGDRVLTLIIWRTPYRDAQGGLFAAVVRAYRGMHWYPARRLAPDLDAARARALAGLRAHGCVASARDLSWVGPQMGQSFVDDAFFTQGRLEFVRLAAHCGGRS